MISHIYIDLRPIYIWLIIDESSLFVPFAPNVAPSAPQGAHLICRLPAAPPRRLRRLISRSLRGLFYPPPARVSAAGALRQGWSALAPSTLGALLLLAAPPPICPQRGLPNMSCRHHLCSFAFIYLLMWGHHINKYIKAQKSGVWYIYEKA